MSLPVYRGVPRQYGYGLGSIFRTIGRTVVPFLKPLAKTVGKNLLKTGVNIASDVLDGQGTIKQSLFARGKQGLKTTGVDILQQLLANKNSPPKKTHPRRKSARLAIKKKRFPAILQSLLGPRSRRQVGKGKRHPQKRIRKRKRTQRRRKLTRRHRRPKRAHTIPRGRDIFD
jgi:hypothetical protein